ncbi:MAG: efflux RND transporter periplasmic adaptor subunit [Pseudomonadales bacterium]|jgi:RND family efflux transporter MFP subunit|nr:efflux RND transporter periplasmic adaptor subunit [Pseudomonadales bacterium]
MLRRIALFPPLCLALALGAGCSSEKDEVPAAPAGTLVSVAVARTQDVPVLLTSIGRLESRAAPLVAAEMDGRVLRLAVDEGAGIAAGAVLAEIDSTSVTLETRAAKAELGRIAALLANEERRVERFRTLAARELISREQLDDTEAQLAVLRAQRDAVEARLRIVEDQLGKTVIRAPLAGRIQKRLVSVGDFVKRGSPLFEIATSASLRALLPVPEPLAARVAPGLAVKLGSPLTPDRHATGVITELRPAVGAANRAVWAIVDVENPGEWRPDATVRGEIVLAMHADAVVVPEQSVIRRPAGEVVYAIVDGKAAQRVVTPGERLEGLVEIVAGLAAGEQVAVEGAAYLSDGAPVRMAGTAP